jgi:AraC-like DNA-binding protein/ligand-binding sensor protein
MEVCKEACKHFAIASGVGTAVVDINGDAIYQTPMSCGRCIFCESFDLTETEQEQCRITPLYASSQAMRFGGKYIYFCHRGLAHLASPVLKNTEMYGAIFAGPFLLVSREDYLEEDSKWHGEKEDLSDLLDVLPVFTPEDAHAFSELLYYTASHLSSAQSENDSADDQPLPEVISQYIERIQGKSGFYPLEKEEELLLAMAAGDVTGAKALLNELLSYIFFCSGLRFDVVRSRVLELIVLLSRSAMKGGANPELIFGLNYDYLKEISKFNNAEDLAYWLSGIMNRFTDHIFRFSNAKHADVIFKAVNFIKANYMKKIVLEDVAGSVYLSPAYFSRVFKQETGHNFSNYLNKIRIDESKKLLKNAGVNISDIAGMVGYEDQSYFSKVFKKITGVSPLKFRQSRGNTSSLSSALSSSLNNKS